MEEKILSTKLSSLKGAITRIKNVVSKPEFLSESSLHTLKSREERLLQVFQDYNETLYKMESPEDPTQIEASYFECLDALRDAISKFRSDTSSKFTHQLSHLKLPKIQIPEFSGKYLEYKPFIEIFTSLVDKNIDYDPLQKLVYLRSFVKEEAYDLIKHLPVIGSSYSQALKILEERYDNKQKIIFDHITQIMDMPNITKPNVIALRNLISNAKQNVAALKNLGQPIDHWNSILVCILLRKLDHITNREYCLNHDSKQEHNFPEFIKYLEGRALALENSSDSNAGSNEKKVAVYKSSSAAIMPKGKERDCNFCGLERVAEELMGRRKWKLYQDALIPRRSEEQPSDEDSMPAADQPPALKIKTIEQINEDERKVEDATPKPRQETILESLIKRPATQPKVELEEPSDWKPADKCYFCTDGERPPEPQVQQGATSPASESDSSSVSGAKSPAAAAPALLQHLLQLQAQSPQTIAQFQQMIAALAALGQGLPQFGQFSPWMMPRLDAGNRQCDRPEDKPSPSSPSLAEQPLDLSAKSTSSASGTPPPDAKSLDYRLRRAILEGAGNSATKRNYTEDELQSALRDIQTGKLGTRRAAVVYGIPRSTLRNKVNKFGLATDPPESDPDTDPEGTDSPPSVILKIPTFPPPDDKSSSPAASVTTPITPLAPMLPNPQAQLNPSQLLLPPSVFADPPSSPHLFSLNDVIAKSISQKFQQPPDRLHADLAFMRAPERHVSVIKTPPDNQRHHYQGPSNSRGQPNNNGQPAAGGKGTRPKRGKYRNYDRDSLVEAVKAVQRGEMSVHRAGSYYGVPHSTLEYKVKERHLMRPRKREPKPPADAKPQPPKPPPPKVAGKPFSNGLSAPEAGGYPPGYGFWAGGGFAPPPAPELYASHMMRRLREEAPPPANGSFLEGIIRSSLERPGALLQRLGAPRPEPAAADAGPPARRARLPSADRRLAAEMRDAVQRLRADKLRVRNGTPTPPPAPPDTA